MRLALAALLMCTFGPSLVRAQSNGEAAPDRGSRNSGGPALNWTRHAGAEACIASVELAGRIEARVKRRLFVPAPDAIVAVEGYVQAETSVAGAAGFVANIAVSDGKGKLYGSRELRTAGACRELDDALVLVISITLRPQDGYLGGIELPEDVAQALDALFAGEPSEADPAAFPVDEAARATAATSARTPVRAQPATAQAAGTARSAQPEVAWLLEAATLDHLDLEPVLSFGASAGVRLQSRTFGSFALRGALSLPTSRAIVDGEQHSRVQFDHRQVTLEYCTPTLLGSATLGVAPCTALQFGTLSAQGSGFRDDGRTRTQLWSALALSARTQWWLTDRFALAFVLGPELHLLRPRIVYTAASGAQAAVHSVPLLGAVAEFSLAWRGF
jgi:hypothetical protein